MLHLAVSGELCQGLLSTRVSPSGLPATGGSVLSAAAGFPGLPAVVSVLPHEQLVLSWHGDCRLMCMNTGASMGWLDTRISGGICSSGVRLLCICIDHVSGRGQACDAVSTGCCCLSC